MKLSKETRKKAAELLEKAVMATKGGPGSGPHAHGAMQASESAKGKTTSANAAAHWMGQDAELHAKRAIKHGEAGDHKKASESHLKAAAIHETDHKMFSQRNNGRGRRR